MENIINFLIKYQDICLLIIGIIPVVLIYFECKNNPHEFKYRPHKIKDDPMTLPKPFHSVILKGEGKPDTEAYLKHVNNKYVWVGTKGKNKRKIFELNEFETWEHLI